MVPSHGRKPLNGWGLSALRPSKRNGRDEFDHFVWFLVFWAVSPWRLNRSCSSLSGSPPALARVSTTQAHAPHNWRELVARAQCACVPDRHLVPDQPEQVEHPGDQGECGEDQEAPDQHGAVLGLVEPSIEVGCRIAVATLLVEDAALAGEGTPPIARL